MKNAAAVMSLVVILSACSKATQPVQCPDPTTVVPASVGVSYVAGLTSRLAGPDRANTISEAIAEIHARDPSIDADGLTNILIAADCPNVAAKPGHSGEVDRDQITNFRAQVDQLLGNGGGQ